MDKEVETVVIGAGITGLVTTFLLEEKGIKVALLEKDKRTGGQLYTVTDRGYRFESGPNTGVIANREVVALFHRLEDDCTLETARSESKKRLIWKDGKFHALPGGFPEALSTPLFTLHDKLNILLEPFRKRGSDPLESVAGMVRRRLGKSYLDYAVDPFISGIYAGDPDRLTTRFALPKLYRLEQEYGSLIRGAVKRRKALAQERRQGISKEIFSVAGGFSLLVKALTGRIPEQDLLTSAGSIRLRPVAGGWETLLVDRGDRIRSGNVILTVPAYALPELFPFLGSNDLEDIASMPYAPVIQIGVGLQNGSHVPGAFGGLIPSGEKEKILGILFNSSCYEGRAPQNGASLSFFIGGIRHPELTKLPDEELRRIVRDALHRMLGYPEGTEPNCFHAFRHPKAIPQYGADSEKRLKAVERIEKAYPGLHLAGSLRDGIGLADRIRQATLLAESGGRRP